MDLPKVHGEPRPNLRSLKTAIQLFALWHSNCSSLSHWNFAPEEPKVLTRWLRQGFPEAIELHFDHRVESDRLIQTTGLPAYPQ